MRIIGIDFEFCTDKSKDFGLDNNIKGHPFAKKLFCVAVCENGNTRSWWLQDAEQRTAFLNWFNALESDTLLLAHFYELAEAQCLFTLGIDTTKLNVFDTAYTLYAVNKDNLPSEVVTKLASLANMCKRWLKIDIDTEHKTAMRKLCIDDNTEGHEKEIMAYCEEDTKHLEELYNCYKRKYADFMVSTIRWRLASFKGDNPDSLVIPFDKWVSNLSEDMQISQIIARNGLPVNTEKLLKLREGLRNYIIEYKTKLADKFKGAYVINKKGEMKECQAEIQRYASEDLEALHMLNEWPRTKKGKLELSKKYIIKKFDIREDPSVSGDSHFMHWISYMKRFIDSEMASISRKDISTSWCKNLYNGRVYCYSVCPNKAKTQRWQGMPSEGYIPQWHRPFRAVLNPPEGKILCECDFHSEETAIFAILFNDPAYEEQYKTDDPYIYNAVQMGLLPKGITKKDLTKEQAAIRKKVKTFTLAWQYGSGYKSLARDLNISEDEAREYKTKLDGVYKVSKERQSYFIDTVTRLAYERNSSGTMIGHTHDSMLVLPDGYPIFMGKDGAYKATSIGNQPIQSFGAYILRQCVRAVRAAGLKIIATVHDAIWIEAESISECEKLRDIMYKVATHCLRKELLTVGEPFIIHNGEFICEEQEDTERFNYFTRG